MTPRALDPEAIERRLRDIDRCIERLAELGDVDAGRLAADWRLCGAVERQLMTLVEAAVKVNSHLASSTLGRTPESYRSSFLDAADAGAMPRELAESLSDSAGLRNVLVHLYDEVDLDKLAAGVASARELYPRYLVHLGAYARAAADT